MLRFARENLRIFCPHEPMSSSHRKEQAPPPTAYPALIKHPWVVVLVLTGDGVVFPAVSEQRLQLSEAGPGLGALRETLQVTKVHSRTEEETHSLLPVREHTLFTSC